MTGTVTVTGTAGQESAGESGPRPPEHRHGDSDSHGGTVRVTGTVTIARGRNATRAGLGLRRSEFQARRRGSLAMNRGSH